MAGDDLHRLSAAAAARRIAAGSLTSEALVGACLTHIAEREGAVGAWAHLNPEQALDEARARDRERPRGPLHGVPIGVKDIMDTADRPTGYGSRAYAGNRPMGDAACVALARAAGAVVHRQDRHHRVRDDGAGQDAQPARSDAHAGRLVERLRRGGRGLHGAAGLRHPDRGLDPSARRLLRRRRLQAELGTGRHCRHQAAFPQSRHHRRPRPVGRRRRALRRRPHRPARACSRQRGWAAPRIGVFRPVPFDKAEPATIAALERAAAAFARAGAFIAARAPFPEFDGLVAAQEAILDYESAGNLAWERTMRPALLAPATLRLLEAGARMSAAAYDAALQAVAAARARTEAFFGEFDAMLVPAAPGEAPDAAATGDPVFNRAWTALHLPCITIPAGRGPAGLPVGVQLVGHARKDRHLLAVAQFAEDALRAAAPAGDA